MWDDDASGRVGTARVEELLSAMTWDEKLAQLQIVFRPDPADLVASVRAGLGAVFWPRSAAATRELQRIAREESRLGIPLLVGLDVVHGQRTTAPVPLAQAATFDPELVERAAALAAVEAASGGVNWTFSPMVDVSRDPRWGRVVEGFGEDPLLTARMGLAMLRGYQGDDLSAPGRLAAAAKHFVGYGQPEGGRDYNTADVSEHRLRNVHLEPFRVLVEAGVASVMASFNTVGGRPVHAHRHLLTDVLKEEFGLSGVVVGDADGVPNLVAHGVAEDLPDALVQSLSAGLDVEMGGNLTTPEGRATLGPDRLAAGRVDDAVRRVLRLKAALGLFDPAPALPADEITVPTPASRALVREVAARSAVLLTNDGTLPFTPAGRVLLTGPYATSTDHLGAWTQSFAAPAGTVAEEFTRRFPSVEFTVREGVGFFGDDAEDGDLAATVAAAHEHDLVVACVGEPSSLSGEAASRSDLRLPGRQEEFLRALALTGTPVVVVLENGRPLVLSDWVGEVAAVVEAWHPGLEGPAAIVDVLTGEAEPAGRLPMTFPRSVGQVPVHYAHENTGRPATTRGTLQGEGADVALVGPGDVAGKFTSKYLDLDLGPLFSFGHGSGYTTFRHGPVASSCEEVSLAEILAGERVRVEVEVTNTGTRDGDDVVQVYVHDVVASTAPPVRRLIAFERVHVPVGGSRTVRVEIGADALGFWSTEEGVARFVVEPGRFDLHVGSTLDSTQCVVLQVLP